MHAGRQLGFATLILLVLGASLALAGPGGGPATADPGAGSPSESGLDRRELTRISVASTPRVARRVERVRELRFDRVPRPEVVGSEFLNRLGLRELRRADALTGIAADDAVGRITGLLGPDEELEAAYESTGDLAAAAYDPKTDRLYVVSDAVVANRALVDFVLAHELDHALEDQRFGLPASEDVDDDGGLAEVALVEGSATAAMIDYAARNLDPLALLAATQGVDTGTGDVPKAYVDQLTWAYLGGMRFVETLRDLAGSWKLVDYALDSRPPATTEQVLHPRKYIDDERPSAVRDRRGAAAGRRMAANRRATCSASCRPRSCSSSAPTAMRPGPRPPAGTATATSSGDATSPRPTASTRAGPTSSSSLCGPSTRPRMQPSSTAPRGSTWSAASTPAPSVATAGGSKAGTWRLRAASEARPSSSRQPARSPMPRRWRSFGP